MDKTEALARLGALEKEAAALRCIIDAPEPEPVEKKSLVQAKEKTGYTVFHSLNGYYASAMCNGNAFATQEQAAAYADAFNTLLDLRRQPGSKAAEEGKEQWYVRGNGEIDWADRLIYKVQQLYPPFDSEASALAAKEAVGWDRILRMYNTLHGRGYE